MPAATVWASLAACELEGASIDKPRIEVELGENLAGTEVWLRVRDNGGGIDAETLDKIFHPFFTALPSSLPLSTEKARVARVFLLPFPLKLQ